MTGCLSRLQVLCDNTPCAHKMWRQYIAQLAISLDSETLVDDCICGRQLLNSLADDNASLRCPGLKCLHLFLIYVLLACCSHKTLRCHQCYFTHLGPASMLYSTLLCMSWLCHYKSLSCMHNCGRV